MEKNNILIISVISLALMILGLATAFVYLQNERQAFTVVETEAEIEVEQEAIPEEQEIYARSPLNGIEMTEQEYNEAFSKKPLAIIINNHLDSRPSAGVDNADVVYEVVAEGGITRLLAIFQSDIPEKVRSVRSARYYFAELASAYHPHFLHWGAAYVPDCQKKSSTDDGYCPPINGLIETNPITDAYVKIVKLGLPNLDGLNYECYTESCAFTRDETKLGKVSREHTAMVSTKNVYDLARRIRPDDAWHQYKKPQEWTYLSSDTDLSNFKDISDSTIKINFSSRNEDYNVTWIYNPDTELYVRSQNGVPFIDDLTGETVTASTLIMRNTPERPANDRKDHLIYDILGTGDVTIFHSGKIIEGTWAKQDFDKLDQYTDIDGNDIPLKPGKIWISLTNNVRTLEVIEPQVEDRDVSIVETNVE